MRYFHGGRPGLGLGALLLPSPPHFLDDCPICQAKKAGISTIFDPVTARPDRVYITTDKEYARFYASKYPRGDLYSVAPVGDLEPTSEDHFPSWTVPAARILAVYNRRVELTPQQRGALLRRWEVADRLASGFK